MLKTHALLAACGLVLIIEFVGGKSFETSTLWAQVEPGQTAVQQGQPITGDSSSVWRFGLTITNEGVAKSIVATSPIPVECPEQTIELIAEEFGDGVKAIKVKELKPLARQMVYKISTLRPGQGGTTALTFKITKHQIALPENPDQYQFANPVAGKIKQYLRPSPFIESKHQRIIDIAKSIDEAHGDKPAWSQVEAIYRWVRENVAYKFDTQIHSCLDALSSGKGDCEELSSLFIAICRAKNIPARAVWIPGHTYPEFYLVDQDGNGRWFPCQAAGSYQFGEMNERKPVLQKGDRFRISGQKELQRYAQPTIKCKDASAALGIVQIANEVKRP